MRRRRQMASAVILLLLVVAVGAAVWSCASTSEPDTSTTSTAKSEAAAGPGSTSSTPGVTGSTAEVTSTTRETSSTLTTATATAGSTAVPAPIVRTGPKDRKWIALTFDDNYQGSNATRTIAALKKYDVPATFFVIGHYVDLGPKLAKEIAAAGFEVGDHTRSHANCAELSARALRIEIGNGTDHFRDLTGAPTVALFRPPGGYVDEETCQIAAEKGFKYVVMWDIDTNDWRGRTAAQITETVMGNAHNGAIVLMHMAAKHTAEALPGIIARLRDAGYELVPLSRMLQL